MQLLKAIIPIYFALQFLGVKDLGAAHLGGSGSESHMRLRSHLKAHLGLEGLPPSWVMYMAGQMMLAVGGKAQLLPTGAFPHAALMFS